MQETEDSILNQYRLEFKLFGIEVTFLPDAIEYVAEISENRKTGARSLVSEWENILTAIKMEYFWYELSRHFNPYDRIF